MIGRLSQVWRLLRRVPALNAAGVGRTAGTARFAPPARRRPGRGSGRRHCSASGWQVRSGCGDGAGGAICPLCSQRVRTMPDGAVARGIEVIQAHSA